MSRNQIEVSEDEFFKTYKPERNGWDPDSPFDGCQFETDGAQGAYVDRCDPNRVWTLVEADAGCLGLIA